MVIRDVYWHEKGYYEGAHLYIVCPVPSSAWLCRLTGPASLAT